MTVSICSYASIAFTALTSILAIVKRGYVIKSIFLCCDSTELVISILEINNIQ